MEKLKRRYWLKGIVLLGLFVVWTILVTKFDVVYNELTGTSIGFGTMNLKVHAWTGVNWTLYHITDWLGLIPVLLCVVFGGLGLIQWIRRNGLRYIDQDLIWLGLYYVIVIILYLLFEMIPINYRPVLIEGRLEASYPSSTTLLSLCVMLSVMYQIHQRWNHKGLRYLGIGLSGIFMIFMIAGRILSGVHWITDIVGSVLLGTGLFLIYLEVASWNFMKNYRNLENNEK
ncbi:MAG: phosphatase PAP2 family protein [Firmicutes bacterium]|nr:phosphatase PAP2 family protein [Bacillota bacterium]